MKRLIGLLAGLLALGGLAVIGAGPASAHAEACVGQGTATLTAPLFYPGVGNPVPGVGWNITIGTGVCTGGNSANGHLTGVLGGGVCGQSYSTDGVSSTGHIIAYTSAGSMLIIGASPGNGVGTAVGLANAVPDALNGESCTTGADHFLVTGVLIGLP